MVSTHPDGCGHEPARRRIDFVRIKHPITSLALAASLTVSSNAQPVQPLHLAIAGRTNAAPWIAAEGPFVAVAWGASGKDAKNDVFVATSRNGGRSFGPPVQVNTIAGEARLGGEMPPRVALSRRSGRHEPEIVVLWTARGTGTSIKLARSKDGGRTFLPSEELQAATAAGDRGWPALALDRRGGAHAVWLDHRGLAAPGAKPHVHDPARPRDGAAPPRSGLFFASAGTAPLREEREVATGVCYCCKTALAVGQDGATYAAWRQVYPGNLRDIAFTTSRDGGRSFSAPSRVSEDGWEINGCPDDGPSMAIAGAGVVHIVWPTVVASGGSLEGALFHASTRDGRTFTTRTRIPTMGSLKPSHPQVVVEPVGGQERLVVAWDEVIGGRRTAFARAIRPGRGGQIAFSPPEELSQREGGMYPVLASTVNGVLAAWTSGSGETSSIAIRAVTLRQP
jgi:hypothetical protein